MSTLSTSIHAVNDQQKGFKNKKFNKANPIYQRKINT